MRNYVGKADRCSGSRCLGGPYAATYASTTLIDYQDIEKRELQSIPSILTDRTTFPCPNRHFRCLSTMPILAATTERIDDRNLLRGDVFSHFSFFTSFTFLGRRD